MKTYSRKSSSYLKKAFIGSNFNEMCRLCLSEVDMVLTPIFQDSQMSYQEWIRYSVDVLVEEGDGLPPNICEECLGMIEQIYVFKKKCKASDSKLREHFQLMDSIESKLIDTQFEATESSNQINETSPVVSDTGTVDPGGITVTNGYSDKEISDTICNEGDDNAKSVDAESDNLKSKNIVEKDTVKPFNKDNIIINEVKRYVWKNESTGEKDVTVCEVVHYDIRNEGEESNDENENNETFVRCYSSAEILEEYSNNLKDPSVESDSEMIQLSSEKVDCTFNVLTSSDQGDSTEKCEGKIQEICQLWDNDDEVEITRDEEDEGKEEAEGECKAVKEWEGKRIEGDGEEAEDEDEEEEDEDEEEEEAAAAEVEAEAEDDGREGLVVDVSWEDNDNPDVECGRGGVVQVKVEENGVVRTHKVYTSESCIRFIQPEQEKFTAECFLCSEEFKTRKEMKSHLFSAHQEAANNSFCEICLKNFTSTNSLKRHMLVHTGVKPYGCEICGRKFSQSSILKRHRYTHGKKKPFECNFCQKSYTQKMNLLSHLRNHGIKSDTICHRCKFCHKSFVHPSGLSRHLKLHKGVKFTCDQCKKIFSDSSALARHVKSSHC